MKVKQFTDVLLQASKVFGTYDRDKKEALIHFSQIFEGHESKTISAYGKLLQTKQKNTPK